MLQKLKKSIDSVKSALRIMIGYFAWLAETMMVLLIVDLSKGLVVTSWIQVKRMNILLRSKS